MTYRMLLAAALLLATTTATADEVAIYRCTDAGGALTVQNMPCPKGMQQEKKVMQGLPTAPSAPAPAPAATTPNAFSSTPDPSLANPDEFRILDSANRPSQTAAPATDATNRLPPPVLFECITYDKDRYISEDAEPAPRCVPLHTIGLDGNPRGGAGEACEMKRDQCARVADGALCGAWKRRLGETEVAWRFGRAENAEKNKAEYDRVQRIVSESACGS